MILLEDYVEDCVEKCRKAARACLIDGELFIPEFFTSRFVDCQVHGNNFILAGWIRNEGNYYHLHFHTNGIGGEEKNYLNGVLL